MRLLLFCLAGLLMILSWLGSGSFNVGPAPDAVPATITRWWGLIGLTADQYQVDPLLIAAVMMQESGGNPDARSSAGANGLMQVLGGPFDPQTNVSEGVRILAGHLQTFKNVRVALAAYNAGPGLSDEDAKANPAQKFAGVRGAARQAGVPVNQFDKYFPFLPAETRRYVPAVLAIYERFAGGLAAMTAQGEPVRWPLDKFAWSPTFGKNIGNGQAAHSGEDLIAPCGTSVKATFSGKIVHRGCLYGNCKDGGISEGATGHGLSVIQQFEPNKFAVYAHLSDFTREDGARAGDVIGHIGMTGWTTGCHLHYAIWNGTLEDLLKGGNQWLDPKKYFPTAFQ